MVKQTINNDQIDEITGRSNVERLMYIYKETVSKDYQHYVFVTANIKDFRYFNLKYGFEQGNQILKIVLDCIYHHLDDKSYAARVHADEFHLLIDCENYDALIEKFLIPFIDELFDVEEPMLHHNIYMSFGLYKLERPDEDYAYISNKAEIARLECREFKHRSFCFDDLSKQKYKEYMMRHALNDKLTEARLNKEFVPYIQPKIDLSSEQVVGGEVLMRWINEKGELIPLTDFFFH